MSIRLIDKKYYYSLLEEYVNYSGIRAGYHDFASHAWAKKTVNCSICDVTQTIHFENDYDATMFLLKYK